MFRKAEILLHKVIIWGDDKGRGDTPHGRELSHVGRSRNGETWYFPEQRQYCMKEQYLRTRDQNHVVTHVYDDKLQFIAVTEGEQKQGTNVRDNS
jgi:hypothetical protein